jgi:hypothetical protein
LYFFQGEEPHQVSRFQLTRTDFPTLGSEKNPDLRPQQGEWLVSGSYFGFFWITMHALCKNIFWGIIKK